MIKCIKWVIRNDWKFLFGFIALLYLYALWLGYPILIRIVTTLHPALSLDEFLLSIPIGMTVGILAVVLIVLIPTCVIKVYKTVHIWAEQGEPRTIKSPPKPPDNTTVEKIREVVRK